MAKLYFSETIGGTQNATVYGVGITSTEAEPKRLVSIIVSVSARAGNFVEGWIERERKLSIIDHVLPLPTSDFRLEIPIDEEIPLGRSYKVALKCGGTNTNAYVTYCYEITR